MSALPRHRWHLFTAMMVGLLAIGECLATTYPGDLSSRFDAIRRATPIAYQDFTLLLRSGPCEDLSDRRDSATVLSVVNNVVTIRVPGVATSLCVLELTPREYDIPGLPAGSYRVDVMFYDIEQPGTLGTPAGYIGGRDVTVAAAQAVHSVPAMDHGGILALALLLAAVALLVLRMRMVRGLVLRCVVSTGGGKLAHAVTFSDDLSGTARRGSEHFPRQLLAVAGEDLKVVQ